MSERTTSKTQWFKQADHSVCLPSGARVVIRIPDLPTLIEAGELPQTLLDSALSHLNGSSATAEAPSPETLKQDREFRETLVRLTVIEPKLTAEDVSKIPVEDRDMVVGFALRTNDLDAEGEHIGGLSSSEKFRKFRGLDSLDALLEGA